MDARETTFRRWLGEHRGILVRLTYAYATGPDDREDMLQDILLALWRSVPSFRGEARESTWVFQVALQVALTRRRAERRRRPSVPLEDTPEPAADGEAAAEQRMRWTRVLEALRRVAPIDRSVLLLALEGASQQEIGDVLGVTAGAAGVRLHRARRRLTEALGG
jgi:RNA polymerase sigma-70 factor (ECF subfamily)